MSKTEAPLYNKGFQHEPLIAYVLWLFGFMGAHRFYYGKTLSGTVYFLTLGLFGIGWLVDLFLIPSMNREARREYVSGSLDYSTAWILLTFLGVFGVHRFYLRKWWTGLFYLLSGALLGLGYLYDLWTLNEQVEEINQSNPV
jgi:TM2 domain-containing membrane protein YozV